MKKGLSRILTIVGATAILSLMVTPAYADSWDLIPVRGLGCGPSISISTQPIAAETYTMRAQGGADCPGGGPTSVKVCVLMQQANGDYETTGGACGAGTSPTRASANATVVCTPGVNYRGAILATDSNSVDKAKTAPVTCPPLD